jgi:hypothetical protein
MTYTNPSFPKEGAMLEKFLYKCPACLAQESIVTGKDGTITCRKCGAVYSYTDDYRLRVKAAGREKTMTLREAYEKVAASDITKAPDDGFKPEKGEVLWAKSDRAELFFEQKAGVFRGYKRIRAQLFRFSLIDTGNLYLTSRRLLFRGTKEYEIGLEELSSVTIESHTVLMNTKRGYAVSVSFPNESGKKWEDYIRRAVREFYGKRRVREFHPRITFH